MDNPRPVTPTGPSHLPVLAVDVDGVISLFGFEEPPERAPCKFHLIDGMAHCISFAAGERLRRLTGAYEMVWATGWEERANEYLLHLLGLTQLPVIRFGGDARLFGSLLERFAEDSAGLLERLAQAWHTADSEAAVAVLHSLKGSAGTMGAQRLAARAAEGERAGKAGAGVPTEVAVELTTLRQLLDEALGELRGALAEVLPPPVIAETTAATPTDSQVDWRARLNELEELLS